MDKKRLAINMAAQILAFAVNMGISFFLMPFVDANINQEVYGFVGAANNVVSWAQIVVSALNTMASRYITISIHQKQDEDANEYFSSVLFGNLIMAAIFMIPTMFIVLFLDKILQVPAANLKDIQILWFFVFLNFLISISTSVFGVATYAKDRLDLTSIKTIQSDVIRILLLIGAYTFLKPYVWYIGAASVVCTVYLAAANRRFTKRLLPEIEIKKKYFKLDKVKELISLGAWNSVTRLSQVLLDGLDLFIANIFINAAAMTVLGYAKTVPTAISGLMGTVVGVFNPQITIAYAKGDKKQLVEIIKSSNRILIYLLSIPIAFVTVYGDAFYRLWMPNQDPVVLHTLTLLSIGVLYVSVSIQVLYHVFIITKKVKTNSIVMVVSGAVTTALVFILLNTTELGIYVIAGVSTVVGLIRNLVFTPLYASKCLEVKWSTFYGDIGTGLLSIGAICLLGIISRQFVEINSWFMLIAVGCVVGSLALILNFFIILRKTEREMVFGAVKNKLGRQ